MVLTERIYSKCSKHVDNMKLAFKKDYYISNFKGNGIPPNPPFPQGRSAKMILFHKPFIYV